MKKCSLIDFCEVYPLRMRHSFFINYSYVIIDPRSRQAVVIDPAWELAQITSQLEAAGACLSAILLTHAHYDHVNLVEPLIDFAQPVVYMSRREIDTSGFRCRELHGLMDGEQFMINNMGITCFLTPGHTPGSMCFKIENSLFTGDTLFIEGCGVCQSPGSSPEDLFGSIQRLKKEIDDQVLIFPGHSFGQQPGQSLQVLRENNIYLQLEREHFISFRMRKNQPGIFDFQ